MAFWRYRIRFEKRGTIRFISHRDLMGVYARAFRRAGLPVRMSEGFHPRPRFSLPSPLAVGIEGLDEVLELELTENQGPAEVAGKLNAVVPRGLRMLRAKQTGPKEKARVDRLVYRVEGDLPDGAVERCAAREHLPAVRRDGREIDIRPYLVRLIRRQYGCDFETAVTPQGTARPAEVVAALCDGDDARARRLSLVRTAVNLRSP